MHNGPGRGRSKRPFWRTSIKDGPYTQLLSCCALVEHAITDGDNELTQSKEFDPRADEGDNPETSRNLPGRRQQCMQPTRSSDTSHNNRANTDSVVTHQLSTDADKSPATIQQTTVFTFNIPESTWQKYWPVPSKKGLKSGWFEEMYEGFHEHWRTCPIVCTGNYIFKTQPMVDSDVVWHGFGSCMFKNCVSVTFERTRLVNDDGTVTVTCHVDGEYTGHPSGEGSVTRV